MRNILPQPRPPPEERTLGAQEEVWQESIGAYISEHTDTKGNQIKCNLSKSEKRGIAKLRERAKGGGK